MRRKLAVPALVAAGLLLLTGCPSQAEVANENLSKACDNFECLRRIIGINTRFPEKPIVEVVGFCSYNPDGPGGTVEAVCKDADGTTKRTVLGKAADVTYVVTQLEGKNVSGFRPTVRFAPENIVPDFDLSTSANP